MAVQVAELRDPKYFGLRAIQRLFHDAFADSRLFPGGFEAMLEDVILMVTDPNTSLLVGLEEDIPKGLLIICFPTNKVTRLPQILHFYNGGGTQLRKKLLKDGVALVKARGYTKVWAINGTRKPDSVWARTFRVAGPAEPIGGILEFDLGA